MHRRALIAAGTIAALTGAAGHASAQDHGGGGATAPSLNINGVGLPVITGGRLRNYVFVTLRLHLGAGQTPETLRHKEAFFRDALVKAGHRTPFVVANDWTRLDAAALSASLLRSCTAIAGRGAVVRVEVVSQAPRRQISAR